MAGKTKKPVPVYWDANVFVYLFQNKPPMGESMEGIEYWRGLADLGKAEIVTSSLTYAEIAEGKLTPEQAMRFEAFINTRVVLVDASFGITKRAGELRNHYYQLHDARYKSRSERQDEQRARDAGEPERYRSLCTPDAIHLATALVHGCVEFHTYDFRRKKECMGLLGLVLPPGETLLLTKPVPPPPAPPPALIEFPLGDLFATPLTQGELTDAGLDEARAIEAGTKGADAETRLLVRGSGEERDAGATAGAGVDQDDGPAEAAEQAPVKALPAPAAMTTHAEPQPAPEAAQDGATAANGADGDSEAGAPAPAVVEAPRPAPPPPTAPVAHRPPDRPQQLN